MLPSPPRFPWMTSPSDLSMNLSKITTVLSPTRKTCKAQAELLITLGISQTFPDTMQPGMILGTVHSTARLGELFRSRRCPALRGRPTILSV